MERITKLQQQQGAVRRVSVFIDNRFAAGLSPKAIRELNLQVGMEVDADLQRKIIRTAARESALLFLTRREHARAELAGKLKQKGYPGEVIASVLDELERQRYLDDQRFAQLWVAHRRAAHPRGRRMVALELEQKGVAPEVAREAIDVVFPENEEREDMAALIRKRLRSLQRLDPQVARRRLFGFLARRGFSYEDVRQVLTEDFPEL